MSIAQLTMDVPLPNSPPRSLLNEYRRDNELWFTDLVKRSPVFHDMLQFPQPDDAEVVDGDECIDGYMRGKRLNSVIVRTKREGAERFKRHRMPNQRHPAEPLHALDAMSQDTHDISNRGAPDRTIFVRDFRPGARQKQDLARCRHDGK
ncbi:hypothetical protein B0H17DRAFT_1131691 [Mycena rosella]|uniref:Uncharacterized protein n=1 Tax=Mycena rosella TaxID=1033263 RepID=A0AAD7GK71_MYCRO|nr:hypothetical protein B0H17DRAFT_1131691 [Mycena rosella]